MKPINTQYKGYLFRSRLEARWAVFFDALGLEWRYEMEGYELSNGEFYLPDFNVKGACDFETPPSMRWDFVEIKATTPSAEEIKKMDLLTKAMHRGHYTDGGFGLILSGDPADHFVYSFCGCGSCIDEVVTYENDIADRFWAWKTGNDEKQLTDIYRAATKARSARFEFADALQPPIRSTLSSSSPIFTA